MSIDWASSWRKEDWWAVWLGFIILALASTRIVTWLPKISKWTTNPGIAVNAGDIPYFILLGFCLLILTSLAMLAMKEKIRGTELTFHLFSSLVSKRALRSTLTSTYLIKENEDEVK